MTTATINDIKKELQFKNHGELLAFCLKLARFKKENKELLNFLLFEVADIHTYVESVQQNITGLFTEINISNVYFIKKSLRKIVRFVNKQIRFCSSKQTEAEILIHFCNCIINFSIPLHKSKQLKNLYETQVDKVEKALLVLHPDLQYDLQKTLQRL